jgi:hypothetical protein
MRTKLEETISTSLDAFNLRGHGGRGATAQRTIDASGAVNGML